MYFEEVRAQTQQTSASLPYMGNGVVLKVNGIIQKSMGTLIASYHD